MEYDQHVALVGVLDDSWHVGAIINRRAGHPDIAAGDAVHEGRRESGPQHGTADQMGAELLEHEGGFDTAELGQHAEHTEVGQPAPRRWVRRFALSPRDVGEVEARLTERPYGVSHCQLLVVEAKPHVIWKYLDVKSMVDAVGAQREGDPRGLIERAEAAGIARITLNNPERRNAYDPAMREQLGEYLDEIAMDDAVKVVHLRGEGGIFSTGADMGNAY